MSDAVPDFLQSAATLRRNLEEAADALARAELTALLACEARIHASLTQISTSQLSPEARVRLVTEIELTRGVLARCRRLGASLNDFVRIGLSSQGLEQGYGRPSANTNADLRTISRTA